jgi:hypothetical protein
VNSRGSPSLDQRSENVKSGAKNGRMSSPSSSAAKYRGRKAGSLRS